MKIDSFAKINLGLLLMGERKDGYTDIATVFQEIDLKDELTVFPTDGGIRLSCNRPDIPLDESNLVWKAWNVFREVTGVLGGVHMHIEKAIPSGGGLGGGSSNAAAALRAFDVLFGTGLESGRLAEMALTIGSDVPFFISGNSALGQGRGEILTPLALPQNYFILLMLPGIHVSTAWAYAASKIALTKSEKYTTFRALFRDFNPKKLKNRLINEMETAVFQRYPVLKEVKDRLYRSGADYAAMSGSGSTMFGIFSDEMRLKNAARQLTADTGFKIHLCRPHSRTENGLVTG